MTRGAELGRGTFTHIGSADQVDERMRELFAKLENPVVTGLTAKFAGAAADTTPAAIPDLYRGEPLVLATKLDKLGGSVEINGRIGDRPWTVTLPVANAAEGAGLSRVWARRKIADAEVARTLRETSQEDADRTILALALEHQLVTRLTSLIAVDRTPSRPEGETLKVTELPLNLPAGWEFEKVFGPRSREQTPEAPAERRAGTDASVQLAKADMKTQGQMLKRPAVVVPATQPQGVTLPKTATDAEMKMLAGLVLMAIAMALLLRRRRTMAA
jgi:Ca-activated chloride channel family protein